MKKRTLLLFSIIPFLVGYFSAYVHHVPLLRSTTFTTHYILPTDTITLSHQGDIVQLTQNSVTQITSHQDLVEPVVANNSIIAVSKTTNYASLLQYDLSGNKIGTIFNGNTGNVDTMSWISDPAISNEKTQLAYVSDRDRLQTQTPDSALYLSTLSQATSHVIAKPDPYSGGIAHPVFDPVNPDIVLYDYYQYDGQTYAPYSTIEAYNQKTDTTTTLTFEKQNAYQEAFSPDGKQLLFLARNSDQNTVTLYISDITDTGLSNLHPLLTGDIAYPTFSQTKNHIYYLASQENKGYNLVTATIQHNKLINPLTIVSDFSLQGASSYTVTSH